MVEDISVLCAHYFVEDLYMISFGVRPIFKERVFRGVVFTTAVIRGRIRGGFRSFTIYLFCRLTRFFVTAWSTICLVVVNGNVTVVKSFFRIVFLCKIRPSYHGSRIKRVVRVVFGAYRITPIANRQVIAICLYFRRFQCSVIQKVSINRTI